MPLYLLYLSQTNLSDPLSINYKKIFTSLIPLCIVFTLCSTLPAQVTESTNDEKIIVDSDENESFERGDYFARIISEYIAKFTAMSETLENKENELSSLSYRIEAVTDRSKEVKGENQKALFKENIRTLKISEEQLKSEVRLLKKALRLLQENKSQPDRDKLIILNEVEVIEREISQLAHQFESKKSEVILEGVEIDNRDVYMSPPEQECNISFNGIDAATKKLRKEVEPQYLFGYTHPKLKNYFKDKDYLTCDSKVVLHNKKYYIWLHINIASKDALKNYGLIEKNSTLKFELLSGEILYLQNAQNAVGQLEPYTGNTNYTVILPLDKSRYKQISKGEIDRIGIMWSSGYEQYEVYNVDVIMNQIKCINEN